MSSQVSYTQLKLETLKFPPPAILIFGHGMNNNPEIFRQLARELQDEFQIPSVLLTWKGHEINTAKASSTTHYAEAWNDDLAEVVSALKKEFPATPLIYLGYSLGAAIALSYLQKQNQKNSNFNPFSKMIFLAPALVFKKKAHLLRLTRILPGNFPIPSLGDISYRAHARLPAKIYRDFFDLRDKIVKTPFQVTCPLLLILEPKDELIHAQKSQKLLAHYFSKIEVVNIDNSQSQLKKCYHHLFVDERSMGTLEWKKFKAELVKFLSDYIKQPAHPL